MAFDTDDRETLALSLAGVRDRTLRLAAPLSGNAAPATGFFRIPGNRLVELGAQVEI